MWSDPIDGVILAFGNLLEKLEREEETNPWERTLLKRVHVRAEQHRKLENLTGKVGFEATRG